MTPLSFLLLVEKQTDPLVSQCFTTFSYLIQSVGAEILCKFMCKE